MSQKDKRTRRSPKVLCAKCNIDGCKRALPQHAGNAVRQKRFGSPLRPEIYSHIVRAVLRCSFTHLIHETSLAGSAGGIVILSIVRRCRDHNPIAVDVDIGRHRSPPFEARCVYSPYLFSLAPEQNGSRRRCRSGGSSRRWRRSSDRQLECIDFVIGTEIGPPTSYYPSVPLPRACHQLVGAAACIN